MKRKFLIMFATMFISWYASAQTEKKAVMLGGNISFSTSNENANSVQLNSFSIGPRIGYFVANNLVLGMEFNYNLSKLDGEWYDYFNENTGFVERGFGFREENFGLSPFIRRYLTVKQNFRAFAQGSLTFQINSYKNIDDAGYLYRTDYYFKGFGSSLNFGFAYYPTRKWGLEFSFPFVRYFDERYAGLGAPTRSSKNFHTVMDNFIPSFGVNFHL